MGRLEELYLGEHNRSLVTIPPGVWHAVQNVSDREAVFINSPSHAYNHEAPDKYRLPLRNDVIPFSLSLPQVADSLGLRRGTL